jgi:hypothetical protein
MFCNAVESGVYKSYFVLNSDVVKCLFEEREQRFTASPVSDRPLEVGPCSLDRTWYLTTIFQGNWSLGKHYVNAGLLH